MRVFVVGILLSGVLTEYVNWDTAFYVFSKMNFNHKQMFET
jgi:hypothetical protein